MAPNCKRLSDERCFLESKHHFMKFDDADYRSLNFTSGMPQEASGTHIGTYVAWAGPARDGGAGRPRRGPAGADVKFGVRFIYSVGEVNQTRLSLDPICRVAFRSRKLSGAF